MSPLHQQVSAAVSLLPPISHFLAPDAPAGPATGQCGVCGVTTAGMYPRATVLDTTGSNITTLFPHNTPYMCRHCTALWKRPKHWHRGIFATAETTYFPLIADNEHRSADRPLWRDLLCTPGCWHERPRACVLTTDPKKRVWPHARVSQGARLLLYLHDPTRGVSGNRWVTWERLAQTLALVEQAYALGAAKAQIAETLYTPRLLKAHGLAPLQTLEVVLRQVRHLPEFLPALIVAQKPPEETLHADTSADRPHTAPPGVDHQLGTRRGWCQSRGAEQLELIAPAARAPAGECECEPGG